MEVTEELTPTSVGTGHVRAPVPQSCRARGVLDRVGDKWSVYVISQLGDGTKRFTELRGGIEAITSRMLTVTLRGLERDGLVTRKVHAVVPPRVEYSLTPMGRTLLATIDQLIAWADAHLAAIDAARTEFDARVARATDDAVIAERAEPAGNGASRFGG
ncbi:MAG: helix-turn-helix domain-containing protein [Actinomycetota bacterium]|nr:helix-turn-helix domain-containing protein [Actinomycetota bacterium]